MPLILPGNVASATAATTYTVANSCRFNDDDSAYMHKTPGSEGDRAKWTFSVWFKMGRVSGGVQQVFLNSYSSSSNESRIYILNGTIQFYNWVSSATDGYYITTRVLRDPSAWYHLVMSWDSDNGTAGNRIRIYINGVEETTFSTESNPSSGSDTFIADDVKHWLGRSGTGEYFDGYMAEVALCDGQTYTPSDFGEFDEDSPTIWKPKDISGLTFGTTGFYLDFEASGNLGNDANGGTDFTEVNLAAVDQATDTPTNNFCTINPLNYGTATGITLSEGNLTATTASGTTWYPGYGTLGFLGTGKWYYEMKVTVLAGSSYTYMGIVDADQMTNADGTFSSKSRGYGYNQGGEKGNNNSDASYGDAFTTGDVISMAYNNGTIWFGKNGTWQNSATGAEIAAGTTTNCAYTGIDTTKVFLPAVQMYGGTTTDSFNFGGCPSFAISSSQADDNGYGNFEYDVPAGCLALCTKNLGSDGG